jgi:hypothetical protein
VLRYAAGSLASSATGASTSAWEVDRLHLDVSLASAGASSATGALASADEGGSPYYFDTGLFLRI